MLPGESRTEKVQVKIRVYHVPIGERGAEKVQLQITVYHVSSRNRSRKVQVKKRVYHVPRRKGSRKSTITDKSVSCF